MGNGLIAFLVAVSVSVWLYAKFMRKSGNNTQSSIIAVAVISVFTFLIVFFLAGAILPE